MYGAFGKNRSHPIPRIQRKNEFWRINFASSNANERMKGTQARKRFQRRKTNVGRPTRETRTKNITTQTHESAKKKGIWREDRRTTERTFMQKQYNEKLNDECR
jgi:hypothetical protein